MDNIATYYRHDWTTTTMTISRVIKQDKNNDIWTKEVQLCPVKAQEELTKNRQGFMDKCTTTNRKGVFKLLFHNLIEGLRSVIFCEKLHFNIYSINFSEHIISYYSRKLPIKEKSG